MCLPQHSTVIKNICRVHSNHPHGENRGQGESKEKGVYPLQRAVMSSEWELLLPAGLELFFFFYFGACQVGKLVRSAGPPHSFSHRRKRASVSECRRWLTSEVIGAMQT